MISLISEMVNIRQVGSAMGPMALLGGAALTLVRAPMGFACVVPALTFCMLTETN